jgi:hypothetical protein
MNGQHQIKGLGPYVIRLKPRAGSKTAIIDQGGMICTRTGSVWDGCLVKSRLGSVVLGSESVLLYLLGK